MSQQEERFDAKPTTVNDKLVADWLKHAHRLERLSAAEAKRIEDFLKREVLPDLMGKLTTRLERITARGYDTGVDTTRRFKELRQQILDVVDEGIQQLAKENVKALEDLAVYEAKWQQKALQEALPVELELETKMPGPAKLKALVTERPVAGYGIEEWFDKLSVETTDRIEREVRIGLAEGESVPDIAKRIRGTAKLDGTDGVFEITNRHAKGIARNASIHVSNQARQEFAAANSDLIEEEQWVATLDTRTCPKCGVLDGKTFPVGEGPMPPAHPPGPSGGACRCARVPVVRPLSEILGRNKRGEGKVTAGTRESMNGAVASTTTYEEWLKSLPAADLEDALGKTRAEAFKAGELKLSKMVDQSGRQLTLQQLAELERIDLE